MSKPGGGGAEQATGCLVYLFIAAMFAVIIYGILAGLGAIK